MNWSRCSRTLLTLLLLLSRAAPATAITAISSNVPDQQRVGEEKRATITLEDLYEDGTDERTLRGRTRLTNATWTVRKVTLNGDTSSETFTGRSSETNVSAENNVERIEAVARGRAPRVNQFSFDPSQRYESGEFDLARDLASDAESSARSARQSSRTVRVVLVGLGVVVVLALLAGGVLYIRSQSGPGDPLG